VWALERGLVMRKTDAASLIDKLQVFALGDDGKTMSNSKARAAVAALNRLLPDLHHTELTVSAGKRLSVACANTSKLEEG
jgi:hypothetical protein